MFTRMMQINCRSHMMDVIVLLIFVCCLFVFPITKQIMYYDPLKYLFLIIMLTLAFIET